MPGLAKSKKREAKKLDQSRLRPPAVYDWHVKSCRGWGECTRTGRPALFEFVFCDADQFEEYRKKLSSVTRVIFRQTESMIALDLYRARRPIGRLLVDDSDVVAGIAAAVSQSDASELDIHLVWAHDPEQSAKIERATVTFEVVTPEQLHGPPVEIGSGPFIACTMCAHDGSLYVQRFATQQAAEEQLAKNIEDDEPFVGVPLD